jgi:hypothetical protein
VEGQPGPAVPGLYAQGGAGQDGRLAGPGCPMITNACPGGSSAVSHSRTRSRAAWRPRNRSPLVRGQPPAVVEDGEKLAGRLAAARCAGRGRQLARSRGGGGRFRGWFPGRFGCNRCIPSLRRLHPADALIAPRSRLGVHLLHPVRPVIHSLAVAESGVR